MTKRLLAYFGLDATATRQDWVRSTIAIVPPILVAGVIARHDGVPGFAGWCLNLVYGAVAVVLWIALMDRLGLFGRR